MATATLDRLVADYLVAATGGFLVLGSNFFRGPYPHEEPDDAVALIWRGGPTETPSSWAEPRFQILVRAALSQDRGLAILQRIRSVLAAQWGIVLSTGSVVETVPATPTTTQQTIWGALELSAGFIGFDAKGRFEFSANYRLVTEHLI